MNDDLEGRLQARLHEELPPAPAATRMFLDRLPLDHPKVVARSDTRRAAVTAVIVGVGLLALASIAGLGGSPEPSDGLVSPPTAALSSPTGTPPPLPSAHSVDGLSIHSVSELLDLRSAGRIGGERVALRGFWSDRTFWSCPLIHPPPSELEIKFICGDPGYGITERDEPIGVLTEVADGTRLVRTDGPALTPFVIEALTDRLFALPNINGQPYLPVPIIVVGHFDDARAEDCQPELRQRCRDRFVLDEIVEFRPEAVPTPGVTPSPTLFPFADPPLAPFTKADCFGDVPYSFIGWAPVSDYEIDNGSDDVVFIMVTRDEVQFLGSLARRLCYAREGDQDLAKQTYPLP